MEPIRQFETGATRDTSNGKFEYDGFLSPYFLNDFARYMHKHRMQADGKLRDSDNWQKGIPLKVYVQCAWRHFFDFWAIARGYTVIDENDKDVTMADAIMGLVFNLQGYWHETQKAAGVDIRRSVYKNEVE